MTDQEHNSNIQTHDRLVDILARNDDLELLYHCQADINNSMLEITNSKVSAPCRKLTQPNNIKYLQNHTSNKAADNTQIEDIIA